MKAVNFYGARDLRLEEIPEPKIKGDTDVIVQVKAAGVCGSDTSKYAKFGPHTAGMTLGHEFAGVVVEVGRSVKNLALGDRVTGCPALFDGEDYFYLKGEFARSDNLHAMSAKVPGCFADFVNMPAQNLVKIPDSLDYQSASMIEPSTVVLHGFYRTSFTVGDDVVIVGAGGSIGLLCIQWARVWGARHIIAIDVDDRKLEMCIQNGADKTINAAKENVLEVLAEYTHGLNADLVIEAAGSAITASQVFAYAKKGGEVLLLGIPYADVHVERFYFEKIMRSELKVLGSWSCVSAPFPGKEWQNSVHFFNKKAIRPELIITHRLPLGKAPDIFNAIVDRTELVGKALLLPEL